MTRAKLTVTLTLEYNMNPSNYDEGTDEEMLAWDIEATKEDPMWIFDHKDVEIEVTGELIG